MADIKTTNFSDIASKQSDSKLQTITVSDAQKLSVEAAGLFAVYAEEAIEARGLFCVAVSRHTPNSFFEFLGGDPKAKLLPWDKIHLFRADEACARQVGAGSNCPATTDDAVLKTGIPTENVHRICSKCSNCEYSASIYEKTIRHFVKPGNDSVPSFDLIMLRMGTEGHIASLFSDSYAFFDTKELVSVMYFMDDRQTRITLTHPVLLAASHIAVLVSGEEKGVVLRKILTRGHTEVEYPICAIWPILDKVTWVIDRNAVNCLPPDTIASGRRDKRLSHMEPHWRL